MKADAMRSQIFSRCSSVGRVDVRMVDRRGDDLLESLTNCGISNVRYWPEVPLAAGRPHGTLSSEIQISLLDLSVTEAAYNLKVIKFSESIGHLLFLLE
jgi:hypothetical protein